MDDFIMKKFLGAFLCFILIIPIARASIDKKVYNQSVRNYVVYNMEQLPKDLLSLDDDNIRKQDLILALFDGLVATDKDGKIIPALASKWSISKDKLTYTFNIRDDAKWNDGKKIVADDFVNFFSRILREENNIYTHDLECIFGVKDYVDKKIEFDQVAIMAKDDNSLEIRLNYPCRCFLDIISNPIFAIRENFYNLRHWKNEYKNIKYSGAFSIESIYGNGEVVLNKNRKYWNSSNVPSDSIHIKNQEATAFALAEYKSDGVDLFVNSSFIDGKGVDDSEKNIKGPISEGVSLNFNLNKEGIQKNINFRKAIKYAVNRQNIGNELKGILKNSNYYIPYNIKGVKREREYENKKQNISMAKELLSKSNYQGEIIKIAYLNDEDNNKKMIDLIINDLKKINIKVKAKSYSEKDLNDIIYSEEYNIFISNYIGKYDSPLAFLNKWVGSSKFNVYGYRNNQFNDSVLKGKVSINNEDYERNFKEAEKILIEDIPCIPFGFYNLILYKKPYIKGVEINKRGNIILNGIYLNKTPVI